MEMSASSREMAVVSSAIEENIARKEISMFKLTIAFSAKSLISLMARGARFLKETPWTCVIWKIRYQSSARCQLIKLKPTIHGLHQTEHTRLCRWMVYSRATTSAMALRPALGFWVFWVLDIFAGFVVGRRGGCRVSIRRKIVKRQKVFAHRR